ncbi:MAG: DUF6452 family protein [Muribaculaceae bacterium]
MMPAFRLKILATAIIAFIAATLASCAGDGCTSGTSSVPLAGFYSASTQKVIAIDSITVYGIGAPGDSMLVNCGRNISEIELPLRLSTQSVQFVFHYDQQAISDVRYNDTITLVYDALPFFESDECGVFYVFDITSHHCTNHIIDSIAVPNPHVSNLSIETMKLFFRTQE